MFGFFAFVWALQMMTALTIILFAGGGPISWAAFLIGGIMFVLNMNVLIRIKTQKDTP